jgi:hypothetical protein
MITVYDSVQKVIKYHTTFTKNIKVDLINFCLRKDHAPVQENAM